MYIQTTYYIYIIKASRYLLSQYYYNITRFSKVLRKVIIFKVLQNCYPFFFYFNIIPLFIYDFRHFIYLIFI